MNMVDGMLQFWSVLLGGQAGPAHGTKFLVMAVVAGVIYMFGFAGLAGTFRLYSTKRGGAQATALLCWIVATPVLVFLRMHLNADAIPLSPFWLTALLVLLCVLTIFVPIQKLIMKGPYFRHLLATLICIVLTGFIVNWISQVLMMGGMVQESSEYNKRQIKLRQGETGPPPPPIIPPGR